VAWIFLLSSLRIAHSARSVRIASRASAPARRRRTLLRATKIHR